MADWLQRDIPYEVRFDAALPGIAPLDPDGWLTVDEAYAGQMACRTHLLETRRNAVVMLDEGARPAACELLDAALALIVRRQDLGFSVSGDSVLCPDGRRVPLMRDDPLATLGRIAQEDFCILEKKDAEQHVLSGAVLCFPASWSLDEKFLRPLALIHAPVDRYDAAMARRVQRLFDGVRTEQPLWRHNALWYVDPDLYQPRSVNGPPRPKPVPGGPRYLRSEKQAVLRLPETGAVVFSIHTYVTADPEAGQAS